jgi:hypothetical protein
LLAGLKITLIDFCVLVTRRQSIDDTNLRGCQLGERPEREKRPDFETAMDSPVNLELIFPIKDAPSASFMSFKASCLRDAGIITESEKHWVDARVLAVLAGETNGASLSVRK